MTCCRLLQKTVPYLHVLTYSHHRLVERDPIVAGESGRQTPKQPPLRKTLGPVEVPDEPVDFGLRGLMESVDYWPMANLFPRHSGVSLRK